MKFDTTNVADVLPLTPLQEGMLFHCLLEPAAGIYVAQYRWTFATALDTAAFTRAWRAVVARHSALRTSFEWEGLPHPVQVIWHDVDLDIQVRDVSRASAEEQRRTLEASSVADIAQLSDISRPPLHRLSMVHAANGAFHVVWSVHQLLIDGWSQQLVLSDLIRAYAQSGSREVRLQPGPQYGSYVAWAGEADQEAAKRFWAEELADYAPSPLFGHGDARNWLTDGSRLIEVDDDRYRAMRRFATENRVTLNTVVSAAWGLLVSACSGTRDVVFGTTASDRPAALAGADQIVGVLLTSVPTRVRLDHRLPVREWLRDLQLHQVRAREHAKAVPTSIQRWAGIDPNVALFDTMIAFENFPSLAAHLPELTVKADRFEFQTKVNYPLTLIAQPGEALAFKLNYSTKLLSESSVDRLSGYLVRALDLITADPTCLVSELDILSAEERRQLVGEWNDTQTVFPGDRTVAQLFEEVAERVPGATALVAGDVRLSYRQLDEQANRLAHHLRGLGVGPEVVVALFLERGISSVVAMLGVLKAGGAYAPVDPTYPTDRITFMLSDTSAQLLITQERFERLLPDHDLPVVRLDADTAVLAACPSFSPGAAVTPQNLAYIIYTSGSTGRPKGVEVHHRGVTNYVTWWSGQIVGRGSSALSHYSLSFDTTVRDTFCPLLAGLTLHLLGDRDGFLFRAVPLADGDRLAYLKVTPSELSAEVEGCSVADIEAVTAILVVGGEAMSRTPLIQQLANSERLALANHYGPSEVSVGSTIAWIRNAAELDQGIPIGRPIANTKAYVLDPELRLLPVGAPGELCIGGVGVSRGYRGQPGLTARRFVPDPFGGVPGARLYRTGDLARYLEDGTLQFLGRLDQQVKVRGYRIEPGEVEAALTQHPAVTAAVVIAREDHPGDRRLVGYAVGREPGLDIPAVLSYLRGRLPAFMVPSALVELPEIPLLPGRKVDRAALPAPAGGSVAVGSGYVAPRGPVEEIVAQIWCTLLGLDRVGAHDDFFSLGGHSLLVTRLVSRLRDALGVELPFRAVFENPSVAGIASTAEALANGHGSAVLPPVRPAGRDCDLPLSFPQQRLWFLDQLIPENPFYNLPAAYRLRGPLDVPALRQALTELVARHELLRTVFRASDDGEPVQVIQPPGEIGLPVIDVQADCAQDALDRASALASQEAARLFDLSTGPVFRPTLLRLAEEDHVLVMVFHHAVADGWSVGVMNRDLSSLYAAFAAGQPSPLEPLPVQYADYAVWQHEWLAGDVLTQQLAYWREKLTGAPPVLELPTDRPRPPVSSYAGSTRLFAIPSHLVARLKDLAKAEGSTLYMVLLAAFKALLVCYTGQTDIVVGTPVANRRRAELEGLIGFFINTLVLRTDCSGEPTFRELLSRVRETTLGAYSHQDLPFEQLVDAISPPRDLSRNPLVQVGMQLQNMPPGRLQMEGTDTSFFLTSKLTTHLDAEFYFAEIGKGTELSPHAGETLPAEVLADAPEGLVGQVVFSTQLFDGSTIDRMVGHLKTVLCEIALKPELRLSEINIIDEDERHQLVHEFNDTAKDAGTPPTVARMFEDQVFAQPDAIAISCGERELTYRQLNERANRLAYRLRQLGVGPESVAVGYLYRGMLIPLAVLAVAKAGGAYAPIDPDSPALRASLVLADTRAKVVLTQRSLVSALPDHKTVAICLDDDPLLDQQSATAVDSAAGPDNLAYVIYTSGSTGTPKGVEVINRGLTNLIAAQGSLFGLGPGSRTSHAFGPAFDAAYSGTVMPLALGATLVIQPPDEFRYGDDLGAHIATHAITSLHLPASVLASVPAGDFPSVQAIGTGAEAVMPQLAARWAQGRRMYNSYGPTETTVVSVMGRCTPAMGAERSIPIGRPIANTTVYVLDAGMRLLPVGVPGELYIGGAGVSRGYRNQPGLTARGFVPDPFGGRPGARLYRTGDIARFLPDGRLEYLGRIDDQVKLRGHRIELGEIQAVLAGHPSVASSVVVVREDRPGDRRLTGYVVPRAGQQPDVIELRSYLKKILPLYMVPGQIVCLRELPSLPSGKVDTHALPAPEGLRPDLAPDFAAPRTGTEEEVARIWADLLGLDTVGVQDDFFELGGHSMMIVQLIALIQHRLGVRLTFGDVFESSNVADLAIIIDELKESRGDQQNEL